MLSSREIYQLRRLTSEAQGAMFEKLEGGQGSAKADTLYIK